MVARRTSSGAGFVTGARPGGVSGAIKAADFYAKLPSELAEGSVAGGVLSIAASAVFALLLVAQLRALREVRVETDVVVDHNDDALFQINFKLELPALSCEWATVDVIDVLGTRHFNISGEQVYKHSMGADRYLGVEHASASGGDAQREPEYSDTTDLDHYGNRRIAYEITGAAFERMVRAHRVLLVNFHAPWCDHCRRLAPVYEHAAELVRDELRRSGRARLALGLATVDCTMEANEQLCREQRVQAYPTVRVYRAGSVASRSTGFAKKTTRGDDASGSADGSFAAESERAEDAARRESDAMNPAQLQFETYHGRRVAEDIAGYARTVLAEVSSEADAAHEDGYDDDAGRDRSRDARRRAAGSASAARALGGQVRTSGCVLDGSVRVNRVPGAVYVVPHSLGHSVDPSAVNVTHTIKHLSFGKHVPGRPSYVPRSLRRVWRRIPKDLGGRFAAGGETTFASEEPFTVHEHHLKVVGRTYEPLVGEPVHLYEYTFNSNRFRLAPRDLEDESDRHIDGAAVKFSYDLSPMRVVSRETRRPTTEWLLGLCAWVGGVYVVSGLLSALVERSLRAVKRRVGKLA